MSLMQNYAVLGTLAGLALGIVNYVIVKKIVRRIEDSNGPQPTREQTRTLGTMLFASKLICFLGYPGFGYFAGAYVMPGIFR